jgi:hypothetical protein
MDDCNMRGRYGTTIDNPFDLRDALSNPYGVIHPGDTIRLRGGVYPCPDLSCNLSGTAEQPITIEPYNHESVAIDGRLTINGAHTHWYNIQKTHSAGVRFSEVEGSNPPGFEIGDLDIHGAGVELYNCILHNQVGNGVGWWGDASGAKLYGCLMFDNGWLASDRGHGHNTYTQNLAESAVKTMRHCILAQSFGMGSSNLALYGSGAAGLQHYRLSENIFIGGRQLIGGDAPVDDVEVDDCHIWGRVLLGYHDDGHENTILRRCRIAANVEPLMPHYMRRYSLLDSIVTVTGSGKLIYSQEPASGVVGYTASGNAYHNLLNYANPYQVETVGSYTLTQWQSRYNCDLDSTYQTTPPADSSHVYPNEVDSDKGIVVVWNWSGAASVVVDISSILGLPLDENYRLRSAVNYFGDIATGTVSLDGTITIDMRAISHVVSIPSNWETALMENPFPRFGTFIVEKA